MSEGSHFQLHCEEIETADSGKKEMSELAPEASLI
jgi:hypothetical protein